MPPTNPPIVKEKDKSAARRAWNSGMNSVTLSDGYEYSLRATRNHNVTYLILRRRGCLFVPVLNFPADEREWEQEQERKFVGPTPKRSRYA
jgi:hypothetical protein